jgi:hypothetical protein
MAATIAQILARKRDGGELSRDDIAAFVRGATDGSWAAYQLAAMLTSLYIRGMSETETAMYTEALTHSGVVADLSRVPLPKVDKHSSGGVGDNVSLHLAAMVACCGVAVPMVSGRGLGHTGGTLDKLEAIPGLRVNLTLSQFCEQVATVHVAIVSATPELAPADRTLYALRDVTATVDSAPLICGASRAGASPTSTLLYAVLRLCWGCVGDERRQCCAPCRKLSFANTPHRVSPACPRLAHCCALPCPVSGAQWALLRLHSSRVPTLCCSQGPSSPRSSRRVWTASCSTSSTAAAPS